MNKSTIFLFTLLISVVFYAFKSESNLLGGKTGNIINIGVVTWGGYAGGQYFNNGFDASEESRFYQEYGFKVKFHLIDDFDESREAFVDGRIDLLWATTDVFGSEVSYFEKEGIHPKIVFAADYSRGGDVILAKKGWDKLENPKIALAPLTPSHSFFLNYQAVNPLNHSKKKRSKRSKRSKRKKKEKEWHIVEVPSTIDASSAYVSGQVDAAVVWSPDDVHCIERVPNTEIIATTANHPYQHTISDILIADEKYINDNREQLTQLFEGWMKGASEINQSEESKNIAAEILADGLDMPKAFCHDAISNVMLCDKSENDNYFGINSRINGKIHGKFSFEEGNELFYKLGYSANTQLKWEKYSDSSLVNPK